VQAKNRADGADAADTTDGEAREASMAACTEQMRSEGIHKDR